jgi:hypothetical protein
LPVGTDEDRRIDRLGWPDERGEPLTRVYLEVGARKVFACALDWPGWCRAGKGEEAALSGLASYATRYAAAAARAGLGMIEDRARP